MSEPTSFHPSPSSATLFASIDGFGRVYDCGECGSVHVAVGPVSLTFSVDGFLQLVALLNESAANFELHLAGKAPAERGAR